MGEGNLKLVCRLLGRSFFSSFSFSFRFDCSFNGFDFSVAFSFNGYDFRFGFNGFHRGFGFDGFNGRLTCESGTSEKHCSGSADKQFRHMEFPSF